MRYLDKHVSRAAAGRARLILLAGLRLRAPRSDAYREAARWLAARPVAELLAEGRGRGAATESGRSVDRATTLARCSCSK